MADPFFTLKARLDLNDFWDFTAERWGTAQADRYVVTIVRVCQDLVARRISGRGAGMVREGYLTCRTGSHFVFFRSIDDREGTIEIVRILHKRMDPFRHIR